MSESAAGDRVLSSSLSSFGPLQVRGSSRDLLILGLRVHTKADVYEVQVFLLETSEIFRAAIVIRILTSASCHSMKRIFFDMY